MQEHRVSHTVLVPTVVADLLQLPGVRDLDWSALKYITYGAAAMPEKVLREALEVFGCDFLQSYGLTESTGGVTMLTAEDHRDVSRARPAALGGPPDAGHADEGDRPRDARPTCPAAPRARSRSAASA